MGVARLTISVAAVVAVVDAQVQPTQGAELAVLHLVGLGIRVLLELILLAARAGLVRLRQLATAALAVLVVHGGLPVVAAALMTRVLGSTNREHPVAAGLARV